MSNLLQHSLEHETVISDKMSYLKAALAKFFSFVLEVWSSITQEKVFLEETFFSVESFVAADRNIRKVSHTPLSDHTPGSIFADSLLPHICHWQTSTALLLPTPKGPTTTNLIVREVNIKKILKFSNKVMLLRNGCNL